MDGLDFSSTCQSEYFLNFLFRLCQESYVYVLEWGTENVVLFCQHWTRDPHPTCARCRGKICTKDMTCDFCADWSVAQWELFTKKRSYKERKKSRPSGSVPPAPQASPRAETPSGVSQPGTSSSSFSRPSGGQDERGGGGGVSGCT